MIVSKCFTWFSIGGYMSIQYITSIGLFYKNREFRVSDFEELVGITHRREWSRYANKRFQKQEKHLRPCVGLDL